MAVTKNTGKNSGFDAEPRTPAKTYPKGSKIKHNSDGTISIVPPKKK